MFRNTKFLQCKAVTWTKFNWNAILLYMIVVKELPEYTVAHCVLNWESNPAPDSTIFGIQNQWMHQSVSCLLSTTTQLYLNMEQYTRLRQLHLDILVSWKIHCYHSRSSYASSSLRIWILILDISCMDTIYSLNMPRKETVIQYFDLTNNRAYPMFDFSPLTLIYSITMATVLHGLP